MFSMTCKFNRHVRSGMSPLMILIMVSVMFSVTSGYAQPPGTVPLLLYWSPERGDNFTTATVEGEQEAIQAGYLFIGIEGYVY